MADQKFKSKVQLQGGASLPAQTVSTVVVLDSSKNLVSSAVTAAELAAFPSDIANAQSDATQALADAASAQADATQALSDAAAAQSDIDAHIADTVGAHAASAISNTPSGNLVATDVQGALNELQSEIDSLPDPITYEGTYNATTNTPTLVDGVGNVGDLYQVTVAGTQDFGSGNITFAVGDKVVYNGSIYEKWDMTDAVSSVFGRAGAVVSANGDYTASQVTNVPSGNLSSVTVQAALNELQGDIDTFTPKSAGDISETSFGIANNVSSAANVTGLVFASGVVRSFSALVSIEIDATIDLFEVFELTGIHKGFTFDMSVSGVGDESGIVFSITSAGQVQYTSANYSGFTSGALNFRAITTSM